MRSRFSAFALQLADYLLETWHPDTRPPTLLLDPRQRWYRLDILRSDGGGLLDAGGTVEFRAYFRTDGPGGAAGVVHEESRFVRSAGRWVYLDGTDRR